MTRVGERGLSIIEAIVIATITALLALLLMPLVPQAERRSFGVAERGIETVNAVAAEREFRALVRGLSPRRRDGEPDLLLVGNESSVMLSPNLAIQTGCALAGSPSVRLTIEQGALVCRSDGRRRALLRWSDGAVGGFSYSADGAVWRANWDDPGAPPFVRFELRRAGGAQLAWVERAAGAQL